MLPLLLPAALLAPTVLLLPLLLPAALGGSHAAHCPQFHTLSYNDPSGPLLMPDGTWHIFPINGNWGHCTSPDLLVWNCSLPGDCKPGCPLAGGCSCTGWNMSNTGGVSVTPAGYFAFQANNYNLSMAKATDDTLNVWQHNLTTCGSFPGNSQCFHGPAFGPGSACPAGPCRPVNASTPFQPCRTAVCGVVGNPRAPFPGTESFSDTGRALKLKSGLCKLCVEPLCLLWLESQRSRVRVRRPPCRRPRSQERGWGHPLVQSRRRDHDQPDRDRLPLHRQRRPERD